MAGSDADQIKLENTQAKSEPNEVKSFSINFYLSSNYSIIFYYNF